jgi:UDP-N-acetylglucosamine--N-acetylmuramyl-(pentapeptide) pyrophosphoryl-undecaprenol N-acetylglucosamine transferase
VRVLIAAGGTAGHLFPGLALADRLRELGEDVRFAGRATGSEARMVPQAGYPLATVEARPFVRRASPAALVAPFAALRAAHRCRPLVRWADVVVSMGGYVGVPVSMAAWREGKPLVAHEQNAVPGAANRLAARWATVVALAFAEAAHLLPKRTRTAVTGNPVRAPILRVPMMRDELRAEAHRRFGLEAGRRTAVVFGGSQGALHLDRATVGAARRLAARADLQLLLITGAAHEQEVRRHMPQTSDLLVRWTPFVDEMELVYAVADLVVSRAGATTIAELTVCGLPSLLVPYPYATARHQEANARALQRAGGASVLLDDQLTPVTLSERIEELLDHDERLRAMAERAAGFGRPAAADALADLVREAG